MKPATSPPRQLPAARFPRPRPMLAAALAAVLALACGQPDAHAARQPPRARHAAAVRAAPHSDFIERSEVRDFIRQMVERHGFVDEDLVKLFVEARHSDDVIKLISPAPVTFKRSWFAYRQRFLDPLRISEGTRFWRENEASVARAGREYGVDEAVIVAIIGVETIYGRITGDFRVVDALSTLAFDYPRRADYFREQLEEFLLLAREANVDVFSVRGSFAGAIGMPQFMPGSIRRFGVDFDGDGVVDLRSSSSDAIGSVARFLAEHGWQRDQPLRFGAAFEDETRVAPLVDAGIEPRLTLSQLAAYGVSSADEVPADMPLALVDLPNADAPTSYYLGTPNFYAITRYNRSSFYAMAVIELARVLRAAHDAGGPGASG